MWGNTIARDGPTCPTLYSIPPGVHTLPGHSLSLILEVVMQMHVNVNACHLSICYTSSQNTSWNPIWECGIPPALSNAIGKPPLGHVALKLGEHCASAQQPRRFGI